MKFDREATNDAKAKRAGIVEQRQQPNRSKRARPVIVEYRLSEKGRSWWHPHRHHDELAKWRKWHAYRTIEEAQKAIDDQLRKVPDLWEFRFKDDQSGQ